jgi:hypothetical protein
MSRLRYLKSPGSHACYEEANIWGVIEINTINSINVLRLHDP